MNLVAPLVAFASLVLLAQALFTLYLMLYAWEYPDRLEASRGPRRFRKPTISFTVLLPARHEEQVIYQTIHSVVTANYPAGLIEIVVVTTEDDDATNAEIRRAMADHPQADIRLESFDGLPVNKPRALNVGLSRSRNRVVTVFDAEDDIHPDIFNVVNTVMLRERVGIVQAGVQLMNFRDRWYSMHNCLEYFFWFKSRLHFHARVGMIPLGGNTVFIRRRLIERVGGWDEECLTEDADIGIRLSTLSEPIRVVYDAQHVTREETPDSVESLIRQRTRWSQGFMQVLRKGDWTRLPKLRQRVLAVYTLGYPMLHVLLMLLWPVAIFGGLFLKLPVEVTMVAFLPLYAVIFQFLVTVVGAHLFTREYGKRLPVHLPFLMAVTFLPYQWLLGFSAMRAAYRELEGWTNWEKTLHIGAHRRDAATEAKPRPEGVGPERQPQPTAATAGASIGAREPSRVRPVERQVPRSFWLAALGVAAASMAIALVMAPTARPAVLVAVAVVTAWLLMTNRRSLVPAALTLGPGRQESPRADSSASTDRRRSERRSKPDLAWVHESIGRPQAEFLLPPSPRAPRLRVLLQGTGTCEACSGAISPATGRCVRCGAESAPGAPAVRSQRQ